MYFVYLLECADKSIYTGITTDVERRFSEHRHKEGGHYTSARGAKKILYTEKCADRSAASRREAAIKKMTRKQKLDLVRTGRAGRL